MRAFLSLTCLFNLSEVAQAGWLASGSISWGAFSFRPLGIESTPNYYAYGLDTVLGFSFYQRFDLGLYGSYLPGHIGAARIDETQASHVSYGLQTAWRIRERIYLGLRGGLGEYNRVKASLHPSEVTGRWLGPGAGLSLGSIFRVDRRNYWQITLDLSHFEVTEQGSAKNPQEPAVKRALDCLRLSVTYTFNDFVNHMIKDSLFKNVF